MTKCTNCDAFQPRLQKGKLCDKCFNDQNDGSVRRRTTTLDHDDPELQTILQKPQGELSAADIFKIVQSANKDIVDQVEKLRDDVNNKVNDLEGKIADLEMENKKKDDDISMLKYTVVNMQKCLNTFDVQNRGQNVIITGVPEPDIVLTEEVDGKIASLKHDREKIAHLLNVIECTHFSDQMINAMDIQRIGKQREDYNRAIKVKLQSSQDRAEFLKNAYKLKDAPEKWKKVYFKKDENPVMIGENNRLRKKMKQLQSEEENKDKEIVIKNNKLLVDGVVIDQNQFFRQKQVAGQS